VTNTVTARPWEACKALARATWTRARATTHPALDRAAESVGLDRSHLSRWESPVAVVEEPALPPVEPAPEPVSEAPVAVVEEVPVPVPAAPLRELDLGAEAQALDAPTWTREEALLRETTDRLLALFREAAQWEVARAIDEAWRRRGAR
jgi:hypothetical protein